MSARTTTFLAAVTLASDFAIGDWATQSADQKAGLSRYFNNAYRWAWRRPKEHPWSEAVKFAAMTVQSGGYINWSDMEYAENWRLWTADPRPQGSSAVPVDSTHDASGIWPVANTAATLWAEYLPRVPVFSSTDWSNATAYVLDDAVLASDGNCYRALSSNTNVAPASHSNTWQVQPVLNVLQSAVAMETASQYKRTIGNHDGAGVLHADAEEDLEDEWIKDERPYANRSFPPLSWR
jgi:hypothetical protein